MKGSGSYATSPNVKRDMQGDTNYGDIRWWFTKDRDLNATSLGVPAPTPKNPALTHISDWSTRVKFSSFAAISLTVQKSGPLLGVFDTTRIPSTKGDDIL